MPLRRVDEGMRMTAGFLIDTPAQAGLQGKGSIFIAMTLSVNTPYATVLSDGSTKPSLLQLNA